MKIALINPPKTHQVWAGVPDIFNGKDIYLFPPLGIMYLSSAIKKHSNHEVFLFDAQPFNMTAEEVADAACAGNPDVVGVTVQTHNLVDVTSVISRVRHKLPKAHIIIGGAHSWNFPDQAISIPEVDSVARGDAEETLPEWLDALSNNSDLDKVAGIYYKDEKGEIHKNPERPIRKNLDVLPFPDRDSLPGDAYYTPGMKAANTTTMITSRGCPYRCNFCNTYQRYSVRSAKSIVDEMEYCRDKYGIEEIHFIDDLFNRTSERVTEISREILGRGIKMRWGFKATCRESTPEMVKLAKEAGCTKIHYGVETGTNEGLESLNKNLTIEEIKEVFKFTKDIGLTAVAYMMIGIPYEKNKEDIMNTVRFIRDLDPDYVVYALLSPYPDTKLFKKGAELGLYDENCWNDFMKDPGSDYDLPTAWEEHISKDELIKAFKTAHRDFYYNPVKVFKTFLKIGTFEELKRIVRGGLSLLKMEFLTGNASHRL
ncbi:MAG: B12-binding domain-containing radical SAM protein [Candidatus Eremiobacteraeota bacterium]|nr:B12-binding domain-containing radical SAM protein [Candidatus Eremiobacteraeota bacterium]